jgi:thioredoxin-related protein
MSINNILQHIRELLKGLILLAFFTSPVVFSAPPEQYDFLNLTEAFKQSSAEKKPMMLYFGRYGCTTCRKMHKEVFTDPGVEQNYSEKFVLAYVDTESGKRIKMPNGERTTEMQFATRNRILGTPTFVYFSDEQKPLFKKAGFQSIEQMNQYSDYVAQGIYKTSPLKDYMAAK